MNSFGITKPLGYDSATEILKNPWV